jgi:hypothetical protein
VLTLTRIFCFLLCTVALLHAALWVRSYSRIDFLLWSRTGQYPYDSIDIGIHTQPGELGLFRLAAARGERGTPTTSKFVYAQTLIAGFGPMSDQRVRVYFHFGGFSIYTYRNPLRPAPRGLHVEEPQEGSYLRLPLWSTQALLSTVAWLLWARLRRAGRARTRPNQARGFELGSKPS